MTQAICDITTDEVNVDVVVEPQADTMVEVANRAGGMEQVFHDNTLIGNGNSVDLGVNTEIIATKEYVDEKVESIDTYTKDQIDGKLTAVDAQIDANADAIQKTRDDMNAEDSRLQTQITAHAGAITALQNEQTATGNQIQTIESKIPDGTSETNPLINKQHLLDEEMDIREDLNSGLSELQTQINAQATAITNLDSEKLDKNQGAINAGKVLTVGDDGIVVPSSGGTGGGLTAVAHDSSLTGVGTDESPLGIASTVLAEIADKAEQTTVETLSGVVSQNTTNIGTLRTDVDDLGDQVSGIEGKIPESTSTTNQLVNATQLSEAIAAKQDQLTPGENITIVDNVISATGGGGSSLPDQTDNAGKFLTTDGTTASWGASYAKSNYISWADTTHQQINIGTVDAASGAKTYGYAAIGAKACGDQTVCILGNSKFGTNVCIGNESDTGNGSRVVAIGAGARIAGDPSSWGQIAIGYGACTSYAKCAIQLGGSGGYDSYTNSDANTFKVGNANGNFEMMSADGTIPADRMSATAGTTGQVLTKTDTGMAWADASGGDGDIDCGVMS